MRERGTASDVSQSGQNPANRIIGLDLCRGLGMFVVLVAHACMVVPTGVELFNDRITWRLVMVGHYFVEQFFAMSGFLIGGILLRDVVPDPSRAAVCNYMGKRWLRTLPVYYVVVVALMLLEKWHTGAMAPRWDYVFFIQNFFGGGESFLAASWSLAIEQWSYLLLPVVLLVLPGLLQRRGLSYDRALFTAVLGLVLLFLVLRTGMAMLVISPEMLDMGVRKQIPLRLDAVLFGLMVAHCKLARPDWFRRMGSLPFFIGVVVLIVLLMNMQYHDRILERVPGGTPNFVFHAGLGFSLTDLLMALTLPFFEVNSLNRQIDRFPRLRWLLLRSSQYSYSVYLVHLPVMGYMHQLLAAWRPLSPLRDMAAALAAMSLGMVISFALAVLLYSLVEAPGMRLRRFLPGAK